MTIPEVRFVCLKIAAEGGGTVHHIFHHAKELFAWIFSDSPTSEIDSQVIHKLNSITNKLNQMGQELDTLTTEVEETKTVIDSAIVLIKGLKTKLDEAGTDPAKLQALSDSLDSKQKELADAVVANTPAEPAQP